MFATFVPTSTCLRDIDFGVYTKSAVEYIYINIYLYVSPFVLYDDLSTALFFCLRIRIECKANKIYLNMKLFT